MLVEYFEARQAEKKNEQLRVALIDFIDMRNSEGFTSIHLASFAGKLVNHMNSLYLPSHQHSIKDVIEYLYSKGGSLALVNVAGKLRGSFSLSRMPLLSSFLGLTAMHTAAQGDQAAVMVSSSSSETLPPLSLHATLLSSSSSG